MKTKLFLIVFALFTGSLMFAQSANPTTSDCDKIVLKKIKKNMTKLDVKDYVDEGQRIYVVLTCTVDEDKNVVPVSAEGINDKLNEAVIENLEESPVTCNNHPTGKPFSVLLTFKHIPWDL
jgi:hypothetical protein